MARSIPVSDEATWLAIRESYIGGSEVSCLFYRWLLPNGEEAILHLYEEPPEGSYILDCLGSYKTGYRLWQEKAGRLMPDPFEENERINAGKFLEPAMAEWSKDKFEWPLRKVRRYLAHDEVEGWGASLDYEIHGGGMTGVPVEFKNVDGFMFKQHWIADGEEIVLPPMQYLLQVQHQMGATGADHGWIVPCVGGNRLLRGRIERHEPTQAKIASAIEMFWKGVKLGIEPLHVADYETVAKLYSEGEKAGAAADLTADEKLPVLCGQFKRLKRHMDRIDTRADSLKAKIATALGNSPKAQTAGYRISWPVITREEKLIPARLQKASTYRGALTISPLEAKK